MTPFTTMLLAALAAFSPVGGNTNHDGLMTVRCVECHTRLPLAGLDAPVRLETGEICLSCHKRYHGDELGSHPVNISPSMRIPPDMLLDENGRMGCITCHRFHGDAVDEKGRKQYYLRRAQGKSFCFTCHKNF